VITKNLDDRSIVCSRKCIVDFPRMLLFARGRVDPTVPSLRQGSGLSPQPARHTSFSQLPLISTMDAKSQRRKDVTLSSLNMAIEAMNLAKEVASITPAKAVFGSVSIVLTMIKVSFLPVRLGRLWVDDYTGFYDEQK
jgi:hypothetical protein